MYSAQNGLSHFCHAFAQIALLLDCAASDEKAINAELMPRSFEALSVQVCRRPVLIMHVCYFQKLLIAPVPPFHAASDHFISEQSFNDLKVTHPGTGHGSAGQNCMIESDHALPPRNIPSAAYH